MKIGILMVVLLGLALGEDCRAAESRYGEDERWIDWMPQVLKAPVAIELRRTSLQNFAPSPTIGFRTSVSKAELSDKLSRSLLGRIQGVLRNETLRAVMIDGRCLRPGAEVPRAQVKSGDAAPYRIRVKSVDDDRVVFLVFENSSEGETCTAVPVLLEPLLRAR